MTEPVALEARLTAGAQELGVVLGAGQRMQLLRFVDLLDRWRAVYNLSGIRGPESILQQHVLDCLAVVTPMARWAAGRLIRVLDVGSGAGLPGLVIAVARPDWRVTTVDAVSKKAAFVRQAAGELGLANLEVVHGRVEALGSTRAFDLITCRAFATLNEFTTATRYNLDMHGAWVAMKGIRPDEELAHLPAGTRLFHVEQLRVPGLDAARCLVWIRPN